mmetsp:Transcript_15564/g.33810  ORF Transcript_15564/g.33810 Transcript_15564/m.33810 type:complete len:87 (-) Transcript_15564:18-278(-)
MTDCPASLLVVTPGLGFDRAGGRLGRGKAYYDKFFQEVDGALRERGGEPCLKVALALTEQVVEAVPMTETDVRMHCVIEPDRMHEL